MIMESLCLLLDLGTTTAAATATCIIIAPKRLKLRLSGSTRKSQKRFRDTPRFKFQAVLARTQPFLSRSVEKRGDQSRFKCRKMVNHYTIRSNSAAVVDCVALCVAGGRDEGCKLCVWGPDPCCTERDKQRPHSPHCRLGAKNGIFF